MNLLASLSQNDRGWTDAVQPAALAHRVAPVGERFGADQSIVVRVDCEQTLQERRRLFAEAQQAKRFQDARYSEVVVVGWRELVPLPHFKIEALGNSGPAVVRGFQRETVKVQHDAKRL